MDQAGFMMRSKLSFLAIHAYRYHGTAVPTRKHHSVKTSEAADEKATGIIFIASIIVNAGVLPQQQPRSLHALPAKASVTGVEMQNKTKRKPNKVQLRVML